jgi:4'-phosphopantetheinyl transferase
MPLIKIEEINHYCKWGLWEITESVEELTEKVDFSIEDISEYEQIHNPVKKLEWLSGKLLLKTVLQDSGLQYQGIYKDEHGKPFLTNNPQQISISHSQKFVACILNFRSPVGIDLERIKTKVLNVQAKFLSASEIETAEEDLEKLTIFWCGKEALYKLQGKKGVIFSRDINLDLCENGSSCNGFIYYNGVVFSKEVRINKIEDYIIAFAL